jgi:hypothetical protein
MPTALATKADLQAALDNMTANLSIVFAVMVTGWVCAALL